MTFIVEPTALREVFEIQTDAQADPRGSFARLYCAEELQDVAPDFSVAQSNLSVNLKRGTLRGLHYQRPPHEEAKLLACVRGALWAVALDLRAGSRGQHHGVEISAANGLLLLLPKGTATGFQTLSDDTSLLYFMSHSYTPEAAAGYHHASCGIEWPLAISAVSERDLALPECTLLEGAPPQRTP